jgi:Carboxypeptidase regulatory-like domain/TonB-dependent Receptor Plug Domain
VKSRRFAYSCLFLVTMFVFWASALPAQTGSTSALTGRITDTTGAVLPGVTVTATSIATNQTRTVLSAEDGVYRIPLLDPGAYRVRFSTPGFKTAEVMSVTLTVTETFALDQILQVGAPSEEVTVEAVAETIQTATSTIGTTVTGNQITSLPLSARNFTAVLGMSSGVAVEVSNATSFGRGSQNMSVNGANPEKNNFQMDGVSINNAAGNNEAFDNNLYTGIAIPNPDAIQEFKIQTSTYDASYGRNPGANVNVVTKSGTNEFHGTLFEFFRNEALNANDFFFNRDRNPNGPKKQILRQNQFGGTLGGPVKENKLFFFGSYQGTRQLNGVTMQGSTSATLYPVPGDRDAADFQARLGAAMCNFPTRGIAIACDGSNINPVAVNLLRVKLPNGDYYIPGSGTSGLVTRLFSIPARYTEDQYIANADWITSAKHSLQMRYMYSNNPFVYQLSGVFGQLPGRVTTDKRSNTSSVLRLTSIVNPNVVNQARVSFQRIIQNGSDVLPYTPQQVGIKPLIDASCCEGTTGGSYTQPPVMSFSGAFAIGGALNPAFAPTNQIQYSDQLSWTKGAHDFRAGYEFEDIRYPLHFGGLGRGNLAVNSFPDFLIGRAGCKAADFPVNCNTSNPGNTTGLLSSSFNLCIFCVRSTVQGIVHGYLLRNQYAFFQDDWKVSSKLTLNVGVRWERFGSLADRYGNLTNQWASDLASVPIPPSAPSFTDPNAFKGYVVPKNYDTRPISEGGHGPIPAGVRQFDGMFASQNRIPLSNFGPRIGFAWQPATNGRLVVRGGAGIFYDRVGINRMVHAVQEGLPYADTTTLQHDIASLQSPFQDRPLRLLPRWFDFTTLTGSNFDKPYYDRIQTPLVRQYNLGIQYEFIRSYVLEVAFVGSSGINIGDYSHVVNLARLASPSNPINGITTNTIQNAYARVPYLGFKPIGLQQNAFDGVYNYSSLQTTVRKNFSNGHAFQAAYTWSKNLSNVGFNSSNLNYSTDLWQQYGQTPYSRPHRFTVAYQYELPFKGNGAIGKVIGGWSASGVTIIQSGNPMTFFDGRGGTIYTGDPPTNGPDKGASRAQLCPGVTYSQIATSGSVKDRLGRVGNPNVPRFFNLSAFCAPPAIGNGTDFGNSGVGIVRGPGQANFDFSVTKTTRIGEKQNVQFRTEFFNLFNHAQFALPTTLGTNFNQGLFSSNLASFGVITSTSVNPRLIQFALRYQF